MLPTVSPQHLFVRPLYYYSDRAPCFTVEILDVCGLGQTRFIRCCRPAQSCGARPGSLLGEQCRVFITGSSSSILRVQASSNWYRPCFCRRRLDSHYFELGARFHQQMSTQTAMAMFLAPTTTYSNQQPNSQTQGCLITKSSGVQILLPDKPTVTSARCATRRASTDRLRHEGQ